MNVNNTKVVVIGLDGATFDVIKPNIEKLPNLRKIMENGSYGELKTTNPPVTCPAWPSLMTGKNPGKHGVFDFMKLDIEKGNIKIANSNMIKSEKIWEILGNHNKRVYILEIPITFPTKKINGLIIAGYPAPDSKDKCYPRDAIEEIKNEVGAFYDQTPALYKQGHEIEVLEKFERTAKNRGKIALYLLEKKDWDLFMINFHHIDVISHWFWYTHDLKHPKYKKDLVNGLGNLVLKAYELMDNIIGNILEKVDENTIILIISDHGHGKLIKTVNLNNFLLENGYIHLKNNLITRIKYFIFINGLTPVKIFSIIQKLGLQNFVTKFTRKTRDEMLDKFLSFSDIDWERTKAYSFGHVGQIYINSKGNEYKEIKEKLIEDLKQLKYDGKQVIDKIFMKEDIYTGKYIENGPDLVLEMSNYEFISYPLFSSDNKIFADHLNNYTGSHRMNGVFIAYGKDIERGVEIEKAKIYDITPTILHIFGVPIPMDMDGRVLIEIFEKESELAKKPIKYQEIDIIKDTKELIGKLKSQGRI